MTRRRVTGRDGELVIIDVVTSRRLRCVARHVGLDAEVESVSDAVAQTAYASGSPVETFTFPERQDSHAACRGTNRRNENEAAAASTFQSA